MTLNHTLHPNEIKVWFVKPEDFSDPARLDTFYSWLSAAERKALHHFRLQKHQHLYLIAHALLRGALSQVSDTHPSAWQFHTNSFNKPLIAPQDEQQSLHFNLSHTDGLAAVSLTTLGSVGIDVERTSQRTSNTSNTLDILDSDIATDILTQDEYLDYLSVPLSQKHDRLLRYWMLKEAYVKATGLGLSAGLKTYSFDLDAIPSPKIQFLSEDTSAQRQCPTAWKFWQTTLATDHLLAVGAHSPSNLECSISIDEATWLQHTDWSRSLFTRTGFNL